MVRETSLAKPYSEATKLPPLFIYSVVALSILPFFFVLAGADFGLNRMPIKPEIILESPKTLDFLFHSMRGAFVHSILEWIAFCVASFTATLAFVHFRIKKDAATPVIGLAFFFAGCMDVFHTLVADHLISARTENQDLIPFTWAACRLFNALAIFLGVCIALASKTSKWLGKETQIILTSSLLLGLFAFTTIRYSVSSEGLPKTLHPTDLITRSWDIYPLLVFIASFFLFRIFHLRHQTLFSHALLIGLIPNIAMQAHMAFGSNALFDSHFNIAHFLKILTYAVPGAGLILSYIDAFQKEKVTLKNLEIANRLEEERTQELKRSNSELEQFAYVASHDLQTPLRHITSYVQHLQEKYKDSIDPETQQWMTFIVNGTARMRYLILDLLNYSRVGWIQAKFEEIETQKVIENLKETLATSLESKNTKIVYSDLPKIIANQIQITQLFQNLIENSIKFSLDNKPLRIEIESTQKEYLWEFSIRDNGIGIEPRLHERIFQIFQTAHPKGRYPGTGIGLSVCRKIVEIHGGQIWVESDKGKGSTFHFSIAKGLGHGNTKE